MMKKSRSGMLAHNLKDVLASHTLGSAALVSKRQKVLFFHKPLSRYAFALAMVPAAILLRYALAPLLGPGYQVVTVYPMVIIVAILAGRWPALLNAALSSLAAAYSFSGVMSATVLTSTALILLTALLAGWLMDLVHHALDLAWKNEQHFRSLFDLAGGGNAVIDAQTGRYLRVNPKFCQLTGYSPEELQQLRFMDITHPDDRQKDAELFEQAKRQKTQHVSEKRYVCKDGSVRWVHVAASIVFDRNGSAAEAIGSIFDITDRKRWETQIQRLNRTLRAISDSSQAMLHATQENAYLQEVCDNIVRDCGHTLVWIGYAENDRKKTVRPVAFSGFEAAYLETFTTTWADDGQGKSPMAEAIRTGRPTVCRNLQSDPCFGPWRDQALKRGYASAIALPITAHERTFGVLTIYSREPDPFPPDEIKLLTQLSIDLAFGITSLRLRTEEEKAKTVQKYFRSLFESAPGLYLVLEPDDFRIVAVSDAYLRATMTERSDIMGKGLFDVFPDQPGDPLADGVRNLRASLEHVKASRLADVMAVQRYPIRRPDGTWEERWWSPVNSPVFDPDGRIAYIIHRVEDITSYIHRMEQQDRQGQVRQELEQWRQPMEAEIVMRSQELQRLNHQLRESEQRFRTLADNISQLAWMADEKGSFVWVNRRACEYTGQPPELLQGWAWQKFVHPDQLKDLIKKSDDCVRAGSFFEENVRVRGKDGAYRWFLCRAIPISNGKDRLIRWFGTATDIHQLKQTQQALQESEETFRLLAEHARAVIGIVQGEHFVYVNPYLEQLSGYTRDEILRMPIAEMVHPDSRPTVMDRARRRQAGEQVETHYEFAMLTKPGRKVWLDFSVTAIHYHGRPAIVGIAIDISDRKQTEDALRESETRFRQLADSMPQIVWTAKPDGQMDYFNRRWYELTHIAAPASTDEWLPAIYPDDVARFEQSRAEAIAESKPFYAEFRLLIAPTSEARWHIARAVPIKDSDGSIIRWYGTATDIHDLKQARDALNLLKADLEIKNKELESIIGIVSHDLRAPLVNIQGFSNELKMDSKVVDTLLSAVHTEQQVEKQLNTLLHQSIPESIHFIQTSAEAMNSLVAALVEVARAGVAPVTPQVLNMNDVIRKTLGSIELEIKKAHVACQVEQMPDCFGDKTQVEQIFRNLLDNAVKYLDPGRPGRICIGGRLQAGSVLYWVADNGIGISPEHQQKIFEPYYQLKEKASGGIGMGLVTVKRMVERNGGRIWVVSEKGKYSTFYVTLPAARADNLINVTGQEPGSVVK